MDARHTLTLLLAAALAAAPASLIADEPEELSSADEPALEPTPKQSVQEVAAAFDLSRPMVRGEVAPPPEALATAEAPAIPDTDDIGELLSAAVNDLRPVDPAITQAARLEPVAPTAAEKRLAQLERVARASPSSHTLSRLAKAAESLAERDPGVRDAAKRLASWAYASRGRGFAAAGEGDRALADFDRAVRLAPDDATARHERAVSLAQRGDERAALEDFDRVIAIAPRWPAARRNRAMVLLRVGQTDRAVADCGVGLRRAKGAERVGLLELRGRALHRLGRHAEAGRDLDEAVRISPDDAMLLTLRGNLSADRGFAEQAIQDYQAAIDADPKQAEACRNLAWVLATAPDAGADDLALAVELADRALRLDGKNDPLTLEAAAAAEAAAGRFARAIRLQQRAILAAGRSAAAAGYEHRLELYRNGRPYRTPELADASLAGDQAVQPASYDHAGSEG